MKLLIYAFLGLILTINIQSQTYNVSVNENGALLTIFNNNNGKRSLDSRINLIDSSFNFIFAVDNSNPKVEISDKNVKFNYTNGIIRGVNYIQLSLPNGIINTLNSPLTFNIFYQNKLIKNKNNSIDDLDFFADFENKEHIASLRRINNSPNFLSSNWFNPKLDYVKFYTTIDAPAIIVASDILEKMQQWKNKSSSKFLMLQRGKEIPIYIIDNDGILNDNDTIIFMGSRAFGDTTFFENYTNKEAFFLTYDENATGQRLAPKNVTYQSGDISDRIYIEKHIEKDFEYSTGSQFISEYFTNQIEKSNHFDTRTVMGEGWFWDILTPRTNGLPNDTTKGAYLVNYQTINPIEDGLDPLAIKMFYRTLQDSLNNVDPLPQRITHYHLLFDINNRQIKEKKMSGFKIDSLEINLNNSDIYNGHNILKVIHKELYSTTNSSILVDYFKLQGNVKSIADKGMLNFITENTFNKNLELSNFNSEKLILINKNESSISFNNSNKKGFYIRASADLSFNNFVTMSINDSVISANGTGLHFFVNKAPDYKEFTYFNTKTSSSDIIEIINNIPENSVILICNSGNTNNSSQITNLVSQLGAQNNVSNINGNWIFATIKGTDSKEEIYNPSEIVRLSKMIENPSGNSFSFLLNLQTNIKSEIFAVDIKSAEKLKPINVSKIDLYTLQDDLTALYITHNNFIEAIETLANFREKSQNIKVKLIDVEDLYNQFNYGNESPHAIKNYLKYFYNSQFKLPKYLTLVGDATWDPRKVSQNSISNNYMPTYGNPVSDFWFGLLDGENDFDAEMIVGRISVKSNEEAKNVVNKLIQYDTTSASEWMRRYLFLTGGLDPSERNRFFNHIDNYYRSYILNDTYCNSIDYVRKSENSPSSSSQGSEIREKINQGNIWTIYIGHAASEIFELDGWSAFSLNNNQKYGLLTTISCNTGAFAEPNLLTCRNEEYLFVPDKGFIGIMGSTTLGFVAEHNFITSRMIGLIADSTKNERNLGELFYFGKTKMAKNSFQLFTLYHFSLLGDPLTNFRFGKKTDPYLNSDNISIKVDGENKQATDKDQNVSLSGKILNYGYNTNNYFELRMVREYNNSKDSLSLYYNELCSTQDFIFNLNIQNKPGVHNIKLIVDPDDILVEDNNNNNSITLKIEVFKDGLIFLDPQSNWDLSRTEPIIRVLNPLDSTNVFDYYFSIISNDGETILSSNSKEKSAEFDINEDFIDWKPNLLSLSNRNYLLAARSISKFDGKQSELATISVNLVDNISDNKINYQLKTENSINFEEVTNLEYDNEKDLLELKSYSLPFKTLSVAGIYDSNMVFKVRPFVNLEVGNKVFVQGYHDRGFNVGVFSATPNGISTRYKLFDTWGRDESHPESNWYKDSASVDLVRFLRDSVSENDYLFIGTSSSVFRLPVYFKIFAKEVNEGSVDTLLNVFRSYGSYIADTLVLDTNNQGFDISFTMVGYKGAKIGSIYEAIHLHGDSARTQGEIFIFDTKGKFVSKKIGEAKKWNKIYLNGKFNTEQYILSAKIFGIKKNNSKQLILETEYKEPIDISQLSTTEYPFIQIECNYQIRDTTVKSMLSNQPMGVSSIIVDFTPVDEMSLVESESRLMNNGALRGQPADLLLTVRNLSLRSDIDSVNTNITVSDGGNTTYDYKVNFDNLKANDKQSKNILIQTDYLQENNPIFIDLNKEENPKEQFYFNNSSNLLLNVSKDTRKPEVKLYIDGKLHQKDDYISKLPEFRVELYDNSPLQIIDSNSITVRVNGYLHPYQRTIESKFEKINDGSNLKAVFTFKPDTLQYEDVSIIIYFYDTELNRDTLKTSARTSLYNSEIIEFISYPNPAIGEVNFMFNYKSPESDAEAIIDIFDINGNKVNSINKKISIGNNIINFFGKDFQGNSLSSHIYFYKIQVKSKYYVEPKFGKFTIIK